MQTPNLIELYQQAGIERYPEFAPFIQLSKVPFKSQVEGLSLCVRHQWFGLFDETGAGKSIPVVGAALHYIGLGNRVVVVTLANLVYQFAECVLTDFQGVDKYVRVHILDEGPAKRAKLFEQWTVEGWPEMLVISYELFTYQKLCATLKAQGYHVLITDESQKYKNPECAIAKCIAAYIGELAKAETVFFPMTGTPMHTYLTDCYTLLSMLSPGAYLSFDHFKRRHCRYKKVRLREPKKTKSGKLIHYVKELVGYQRQTELSANLYARARRVLKSEIPELKDLKDPIITEVAVHLSPRHLELYRKLSVERFLEFDDGVFLTVLQEQELRQKVLQIVTCPELFILVGKTIENQVLETCRTLIDEVCNDSKVILFVNFRKTVTHYAEAFANHNPTVLFGGLTSEQRKANRDKFLNDPSCRLLVANARSAGAGFNFQGECHTVIFCEPTGSPGEFKQAMDRIVRPGQAWQCNIYVLKALNTVAPNAIKNMLRRDSEIGLVTLDPKTLRHFYNIA